MPPKSKVFCAAWSVICGSECGVQITYLRTECSSTEMAVLSTYTTIFTTDGAFVTCAGPTAWRSIDRVVMSLRTTDGHLTSPEYLNSMFFAHMLAGAVVNKIAIALRGHTTHHFPYRQACARLGVAKSKPIPPAAPKKFAKNDLLVLFISLSSCRAIQIYRQEGHFCALRPFRVALLQCHDIWPRVGPRHRARTLFALLCRDVSAGLSQQAVTCR